MHRIGVSGSRVLTQASMVSLCGALVACNSGEVEATSDGATDASSDGSRAIDVGIPDAFIAVDAPIVVHYGPICVSASCTGIVDSSVDQAAPDGSVDASIDRGVPDAQLDVGSGCDGRLIAWYGPISCSTSADCVASGQGGVCDLEAGFIDSCGDSVPWPRCVAADSGTD